MRLVLAAMFLIGLASVASAQTAHTSGGSFEQTESKRVGDGSVKVYVGSNYRWPRYTPYVSVAYLAGELYHKSYLSMDSAGNYNNNGVLAGDWRLWIQESSGNQGAMGSVATWQSGFGFNIESTCYGWNFPMGTYTLKLGGGHPGTAYYDKVDIDFTFIPDLAQVRFIVKDTNNNPVPYYSFALYQDSFAGSGFGSRRFRFKSVVAAGPDGTVVVPDCPKNQTLTVALPATARNAAKEGYIGIIGNGRTDAPKLNVNIVVGAAASYVPTIGGTDSGAQPGGSTGPSITDFQSLFTTLFTPSSTTLAQWVTRRETLLNWGPFGAARQFASAWASAPATNAVDSGPETAPVWPLTISWDGQSTSFPLALDLRPWRSQAQGPYGDGRSGSLPGTFFTTIRPFLGFIVVVLYVVALGRWVRPRLHV